MGKLADYLSDTFRAPNEAELAYEWRRFRQRMIILGITLVICLIIACLYGMTLNTENHMMQGTWILQEDYEDGFHPKDRYLEYRNGTYYMSGSRLGKPTRRDGKLIISHNTPMGQRERTLSFEGDTMTMTYIAHQPNVILSNAEKEAMQNNPAYGGPYGAGSNYALIQQIVQDTKTDKRVVETYIRISNEIDLTEEQRDELY